MKLIIIGYGRMGKAIESEAQRRGHSIALILDKPEYHRLDELAGDPEAVGIDFTQPDQAAPNALACLEVGIPIVIGTTGWQEEYPSIKGAFQQRGGALLTASNFSPGVNFMLGMAQQMAAFADRFPEYAPHLSEVHHIHKKDAPSGTAVSLAEAYLAGSKTLHGWQGSDYAQGRQAGESPFLPIEALRQQEVFGIHTLSLSSPTEVLQLTHEAKDRRVFAAGAVTAAEWLLGRHGVFTMQDVLGL